MKRLRILICRSLGLFALGALALTLRANDITDNLTVTGDDVTVEEKGDEVLVTFRYSQAKGSGAGTLKLTKGSASARILAVGGGGSGGRVLNSNYGGGGGGGAGGMVEVSKVNLKGGYEISVGKGGLAIPTTKTGSTPGNSGDDTTFTKSGVQVADVPVAKGGGGGGAGGDRSSTTGVGKSGGSGGGGSSKRKNTSGTTQTEQAGGSGTTGQGNAGGKATAGGGLNTGAGGGGAGAQGGDAVTSGTATKGGDGLSSDITGSAVWYAGGGAGADSRSAKTGGAENGWSGGKGGGGAGGGGKYTGSRDGTDGLGGGGGGGGIGTASGKGGDGILIVRLSGYMVGGVVLPSVPKFVYDGTEKTAATATDYYTLSGDVKKTNAGTGYQLKVTLTEAGKKIGWDDESKEETRIVTWSIAKKPIEKPVYVSAESKPYNWQEQQGYQESADYMLSDANKGKDAATYKPTAKLNDPDNTEWKDGSPTTRTDLSWTITPLSVDKPTRTAATYTYTGNVQTGYVENVTLYTLSDENRQVNAGTYTVTASLKDATNTKWSDGAANPRNDLEWTMGSMEIAKPTAKSGLVFTGAVQTGYDQTEAEKVQFTLSGHEQTNVGDYQFTATLNNPTLPGGGVAYNYKWKNGNSDPHKESWSIAAQKVTWPPAGALHEYPYAKGVTRTPVPPSDWYAIEGTGSAEAAGDYSCTVKLNYNSTTITNVTWQDGTAGDQTWKWAIQAQLVPVPETKDFTYDEDPPGTPVPHTVLTIDASDPYEQVEGDALTQTQAKEEYVFTLALKDPGNTLWTNRTTGVVTTDNQDFSWQIKKADNVISDLRLEDWQYGNTPSTPFCKVKFSDTGTSITYTWSSNRTDWTAWRTTRPTEAGTYYLQAASNARDNWNATNAVRRFCIWTNPKRVFTDYADITLTDYVQTANPTNIRLKISEAVASGGVVSGGIPGFEYARAGKEGRELRFVLTNAVETSDKLLPYTNITWSTAGTSTLQLRLPYLKGESTTIRMYWHAKDGDPKSDNYPEDAAGKYISPQATFSLVNREGTWINYWTKAPSITKTQWEKEEPPKESDVTDGVLKVGDVKRYYLTMPVGTTNETIQTEAGSYVIVFTMKNGTGYALYAGEQRLAYEVVWHNIYEDLGGTVQGRILLGNNDDYSPNGITKITGQGYWQTDPKYGTYWKHEGTAGAHKLYPYLTNGVDHTLYSVTENGSRVLWHLKNVLMGGTYLKTGSSEEHNYLPFSETSKARTSDETPISWKEVTHLVLRNMGGLGYTECPAIYSPCYSNGIGTIYFDAVNGWATDPNAKIVIEMATVTSKGEAPTDANCAKGDDPYYYLSHSAEGEVLGEDTDLWQAVTPRVLFKAADSTSFVEQYPVMTKGRVPLKVTTGGTDQAFYRIFARLQEPGPVRFRIRRPEKSEDTAADTSNLILIDNLLVSPPAMSANLKALGTNDEERGRTGKQTLGQACALETAFPARTDTGVHGRAAIAYNTAGAVPGMTVDKSKFVASAQMYYRWRYLNQTVPAWQVLYLDHTKLKGDEGEILKTVLPMDFKGMTGDVEWYYKLSLQAPAYNYVDYSDRKVEKPVGSYIEEIREVEDHMDRSKSVQRLASAGTDWFVRLRDGCSPWEVMKVRITAVDASAKPIEGVYEMEVVSDNMWRALVVVPTNATGACTFAFEGENQHVDSPDEVTVPFQTFGVSAERFEGTIPCSGSLVEKGNPVQIKLDNPQVAGYLEFRMSDRFLTYQLGRAEYQDFNSWNDAHTVPTTQYSDNAKFRADSTDTNSSNVAEMKTETADMTSWKTFVNNDKNWNETFYLTDYDTKPGDRFEKEILHITHETPNDAWTAQNITFVSEQFAYKDRQSQDSGLAGKLLGSGKGILDFTGALAPSMPEGIEKITLNARIGQSYTFDAVSYDKASYLADNYMFFVPVTMSQATKTKEAMPTSMAVGAAVSLVGYYNPDDEGGCYEFRIERLYLGEKQSAGSKKTVRLSIYKWYDAGYQWTSKRLCYKDFTAADETGVGPWSEEKATTIEHAKMFAGMFISLETAYSDPEHLKPSSTRIICGLSDQHATDKDRPWGNFTETANYVGLTYTDTSSPLGWGSYGVMAKDCPAQFVMPAHRETPFSGEIKAEKEIEKGKPGKYFEKEQLVLGDDAGFVDDRNNLRNPRRWVTAAGRCEPFLNNMASTKWYGLRTPTNLVQKLDLYLKPKGTSESQWTKYGTKDVVGYGFKEMPAYDLKVTGQWDVRLRTGTNVLVDVVVDAIRQYRWQAPDINDPAKITSDDRSTIFVYSQGLVQTNTAKQTWLDLQPCRALTTRPVSLRSPVMKGLGKFTFSYKNADAKAEIWVQVATNTVNGNLTGEGGYNDSLKSVELGQQAQIGEWITVAKYSTTSTGDYKLLQQAGSDSKTLYLGWHDHPGKPIRGLFRLVVPPTTVASAVSAAKGGNVDYGKISITACSCTDEPGMSDRSWYAWNMRTVGDSTDQEKRMNLVDMVIAGGGQGLVAALNNSTRDVEDNKKQTVDPEDKKLKSRGPAIYSPTMKSADGSGIGSVAVKARLYYGAAKLGGGQIVVWGAKDSRATDWTPLCTNFVTTAVFTNFVWTAGRDVYKAVKFEISDPSAKTSSGKTDRVLLDEIVIGEKVPPTIGFIYARPFRNDLFSREPIKDILSPTEQPLAGESWGVQTQLSLQQLTDEIDVDKGFEVHLSYYKGTTPWGYKQWGDLPEAVKDIKLQQVGPSSNLVFRSIGDSPESLVDPALAGGEVVQFMLTVKYWDRGGKSDEVKLSTGWRQPDWFYPLDYNAENGGDVDSDHFAAYTVLDTVSPGRAWINEVSWNDGTAAENGGKDAVTHQYIEICVPIGVDLTDWYLRVTDPTLDTQKIATFGDVISGIPSSKNATPNATNGYEFLVLQSPATRKAGGICRPGTTTSVADGTWYEVDCGKYMKNGTLYYGEAYQFELVRPSGIVEHQFVMGGTNELSSWSWGAINDATNLVHDLNLNDLTEFPYYQSPKRFYARDDVSRLANGKDYASTGVVGGEDGDDTANWPGGSNTWKQAMAFTPGQLNVGQTIPKGWFAPANGTNSWVYFIAEGAHVQQDFAGNKNRTILVVMPQGRVTNITYHVDNWFELTVTENDMPKVSGKLGTYVHTISPTGTYYVVARDVPQHELSDIFGLTEENPYSSAVRRWLADKYNEYSAKDIRLARYKGLQDTDNVDWLTLTDMYWLDIPPVPQTPEEWKLNDGTNWWLRGGITKMDTDHKITRQEGGQTVTYTNKQVDVKLFISNACTTVAYAPQRLQGLDYEKSDGYVGAWTSVTFKVCGRLDLSTATEFLPFRIFTFNADSFTGAEGDATMEPKLDQFSSRIDILDPFRSPIGRNYDWDKYPSTKAYFKWKLNADHSPYSTEKLKADSTYPETD